jgi:hypothetical protein
MGPQGQRLRGCCGYRLPPWSFLGNCQKAILSTAPGEVNADRIAEFIGEIPSDLHHGFAGTKCARSSSPEMLTNLGGYWSTFG